MSKFHSTVSRRDFMKGLGLAGAGFGAAAATAPVFHDLDEVMSASAASHGLPWYVKELELEKPTVEIDWGVYQRIDRTRKVLGTRFPLTATSSSHAKLHEQMAATREKNTTEYKTQWMREHFSKCENYQGPSLRDRSLTGASAVSFGRGGSAPNSSVSSLGVITSPQGREIEIPTPESRGMTKWQGTPEENLRMLRSASRFFGASDVGCVPFTEKTRKLVHLNSGSGKPYNFRDAEVAENTDTEFVIPNKCTNTLFFSTLEAAQAKVAPAPTWTGYDHYGRVKLRIHYFLGSLGYQHIEVGCNSNSFAVFAGIAEHSRAAMLATSPKYGNMLRGMHRIVTDLPLAATPPIDAGIARFCVTCKTCAEACPYQCLPMGDASWTHESAEEERLQNYVPGYKGWRLYNFKCPRCKNCHTACPFNAYDLASMHSIIRATAATTSIFNSFFADMHTAFGYGTRNPDDWWEEPVPTGFFDPACIKH